MKNVCKKCFDCKIALAILLPGLITTVLYCIYHPVFGTNDDYILSVMFQSGDTHNIFLNYFLASFTVWLQKVFTGVNMFIVLQISNVLLSFVIFNYVFLSSFRGIAGVVMSFVFDACFLYMGIVYVQWTHTAAFLCSAGFALLFYAFMREKRKWARVIQLVLTVIVLVMGVCYRFIVFEMSLAIFCLMCACVLLEKILVSKRRDGSLKKALWTGVKSFLGIAISLVIIVPMAFGVRFLSDKCNASERFAEFKAFNSARSRINDYNVARYKGNEEFYNSIDILSQNDITTVKRYFFDSDFFTTERFQEISQYSQKTGSGSKTVKQLFNMWVNRIDKLMPFHVGRTALIIMTAAGVLIAAILLFIFRNKLKLLFPILLTIAWLIFLYRFLPSRNTFPQFALAVVFSVSSFFYNRYHFLLTSVLSAVIFAFYEYQYLSRLSYRVFISFFLPALVFLLVAMSNDRLRVKYRNLSVSKKGFAYGVIALFSAATIVFVGYHNLKVNPITKENKKPVLTIQNYVKEHSEDLFFYNTKIYSGVDTSRDRPLQVSDTPENAIVFGDWQIASYYYDNLLEKNGVDKLFEEMIDNEHRHFILPWTLVNSMQTYYNQHYAKEGETIKAVPETNKKFSKWFCIFKIVTVKE